jgi:hypothetical protein
MFYVKLLGVVHWEFYVVWREAGGMKVYLHEHECKRDTLDWKERRNG